MGYKPVLFSDCDFSASFPEFNWKVSISIDKFNFADTTPFKVFWAVEPPEICPNTESMLKKNWEFYDLILTWNHTTLSECGHTKMFPCSAVWNHFPDTSKKQFQTSYLTSNKTDCSGHRYRQTIFDSLPAQLGAMRITKHKSPPAIYDKSSMFEPFQFSIIMENCRRNGYFTEKILDCMASKTIPIYWGCPTIADFFNMGGIIPFSCYNNVAENPLERGDDLKKILEKLTPDYYAAHAAVIEENYHKALFYKNPLERVTKAIQEALEIDPRFVHGER
jgi:hypothetical protein